MICSWFLFFDKGTLRSTIFESAHLILLCYFGDIIRWAVSAEKNMAARNRLVNKATYSLCKKQEREKRGIV